MEKVYINTEMIISVTVKEEHIVSFDSFNNAKAFAVTLGLKTLMLLESF